ncbi:NADase-type glycan-binding domain-containing protein [Leptospira sarikeiensis]|uniref:NAD glycohydrolase translocation F5/8 type C domain-containing protein n=1 Tax=Leptospira sarikeiensis TaxID=2484943 RepID=A0A4R9K1M5_9LEPT|nr:hypothetical protein [Leptospira sarikeiensis]TGL58714.1 hypothetical protein EHQ64_16820 [Leptospira sarikeiensis]
MLRTISLIILILINFIPLYSQLYDATPCSFGNRNNSSNSNLESLTSNNLKKFDLWEQSGKDYPNYYSNWTSSILKPEGVPPKKQISFNIDGLGKETVYTKEYISYTCKYSPAAAFDNNTGTAWSEGVEGDGIGKYIFAKIDITKPIKIWNGFGKNENLYYKNNRVKDSTIYIFVSKCNSHADNARAYHNFFFIDKFRFTLQDLNSFQEIKVPNSISEYFKKIHNEAQDSKECGNESNYTSFIAIQIDSVYKGSSYSDTLITEIKN